MTDKTPRILFADDDLDLCRVIEVALADAPFRIVFANDGKAALFEYEKARTERDPFNLLVLDVMMTGASGLGVAEEIRARGDWTTPIVFFTADNSVMTVERERAVRPLEVWRKPADILGLRAHLQEILQP